MHTCHWSLTPVLRLVLTCVSWPDHRNLGEPTVGRLPWLSRAFPSASKDCQFLDLWMNLPTRKQYTPWPPFSGSRGGTRLSGSSRELHYFLSGQDPLHGLGLGLRTGYRPSSLEVSCQSEQCPTFGLCRPGLQPPWGKGKALPRGH